MPKKTNFINKVYRNKGYDRRSIIIIPKAFLQKIKEHNSRSRKAQKDPVSKYAKPP